MDADAFGGQIPRARSTTPGPSDTFAPVHAARLKLRGIACYALEECYDLTIKDAKIR
jgi:hypothetical protein